MSGWPFVGRVDELQRLRELVTGDGGNGVVVAGQAGVGKTRLARECVRLAERAGLATVQATATHSARVLPFGALAPLLPGDARIAGTVDDRAWLLRQSAAALVERAGGRRLVVLVDDAHLLDDASATLMHHIAATGSAFVLVTTRTGNAVPDPVVALWRDGLAERIELSALPDETLADLLAAALGGSVEPATVSVLVERAAGNVLFLRELVMAARQSGVLAEESGLWQLRGALALSDRLVELVQIRLGDLEPSELALLELVAYGEPLGEAELTAVGDPALTESLEHRALLVSQVDGRRLTIRLAHPLHGEVLRTRTPAIRARVIARQLAEAVEATGARRREDTLRVASWRLTGGGSRPEVLLAGATEARWRYDFPLAERLARAAMEAGAGFDASLLAAQLTLLQGRSAEAERQLTRLAHHASDDTEQGTVALTRIDAAFWAGRDAQPIVDEALATVRDPALRDALEAGHAHLTLVARGPAAAVEVVAPLLQRAKGRALCHACIVASISLGRLGRIEKALDTARRGLAAHLATTEPLPWYPWYHDLMRCLTLHYAGRFHEADQIASAHYQQALAERSIEAQAMFGLVPAWCAPAERGHVRTAAQRAREVVALGHELDRPLTVSLGHVYGALALALAGRAQQAQDNLHALDALSLPTTHFTIELLQARAWTAVAAGHLPDARQHLQQAAKLGEDTGDLVGATAALHGLARLGHATDIRHRLADIAAHIQGHLAPARITHTNALAHHDADALETVSRAFETMGADLLAAEAAADAADARRRTGQTRAAADQHRAAILAHRCENPVTPALQAIQARARLTPAERDTARLAATGLTSKQIARQLHLSVRTIENRLQRTYQKLGITKRTDLTHALDTHPPQPHPARRWSPGEVSSHERRLWR